MHALIHLRSLFMHVPLNSASRGTMMPARIHCSKGKCPATAAAFSCSGCGAVKAGYGNAACCAPNALREHTGPGYIPASVPWDNALSPGWGMVSRPGLGMIPVCWSALALLRIGELSGRLHRVASTSSISESRLLLRCDSPASRASIRKFFDLSMAKTACLSSGLYCFIGSNLNA